MRFSAILWKEEDKWVSLCPELDVASQGSSPEEAIKMLKEAVRAYIETAKDLGVWEDIKNNQVFLSTIEV